MTKDSDNLEALFNSLDDSDGHEAREEYLYGIMNYMGNKESSLAGIMPHIPYADRWIDVFGGGGAVTIARRKSKFEVYNDRCSGLTAFFRCLANSELLTQLIEQIELMPHSRELFIYSKENFEADQNIITRAAKFYYMVQCSFAGRSRYFGRDLKGRNTVWSKIHEKLEHFPLIHERFKGVLVENLDWRRCFSDFDSSESVFYLDPPYVQSNVYRHNMSRKDHIEMCQRIFQLEGFVALSGYENEIYDAFPWDNIHAIEVNNRVVTMSFDPNRHMAGREGTIDRSDRREFLWIKEFS